MYVAALEQIVLCLVRFILDNEYAPLTTHLSALDKVKYN